MLRKYMLFFAGLALLFYSCDDVVTDPVVRVGPPITLSSPAAGSTVVFTDSTLEDVFTIYSWTEADFGFQAAVDYTLEMDTAGNNFANAISLGVTSDRSITDLTNNRVNNFAVANNFPGGDTSALEFRVTAVVNDDVETILSNVITINIVPIQVEVATPMLNVPGSYQGWDPGLETTVIYSRDNDDIYTGYLYFSEDNVEFKYALGSWDTNWGDTGADGILDLDGDNIVATTAGMYFLTADIIALTHTYEIRNWGIIGTATPGGWDTDTDMIWDEAKSALTITMDMAAGGEYKFRANDAWDVNLGDNDADGSLEQDGANIIVAEDGNYTIDLILNRPVFTYSVVKN